MNNISYSAKYRVPGFLRRKVILKDVVGDGVDADLRFRFFHLLDGRVIYIPLDSVVEFSKERSISIGDKINREAGH